jgi:hypothetical protein
MIFIRSMMVWLVFIVAESLNGTVRNLWLIPALGDRLAHQVSFFTGSVLIIAIATLFIRWLKARSVTHLLSIGLLWLLLTLGFEISLGRFILGYDWQRIAADYNLAQGGLMSIGLGLLLFAPLIATNLRGMISRPRYRVLAQNPAHQRKLTQVSPNRDRSDGKVNSP